jgi:hypothetical protein
MPCPVAGASTMTGHARLLDLRSGSATSQIFPIVSRRPGVAAAAM